MKRIKIGLILVLFLILFLSLLINNKNISNDEYVFNKSEYISKLKKEISYLKKIEKSDINYFLHSPEIDSSAIDKLHSDNLGLIKKFKNFFNVESNFTSINYHLYRTFEDKGLLTKQTFLSHSDLKNNSIHVIKNNWIDGNDFSDLIKLITYQEFGISDSKFLSEALAIKFSKGWRNKGYEYWASRFYKSGFLPKFLDLFDNHKIKYESKYIVESLAGTFADFLIKSFGKEKFLDIYKNPKKIISITNVENDWNLYLKELSKKYQEEIENDRNNFQQNFSVFQKGFCFAHEGYNIYDGYISRLSLQALKRLSTNNVNAISITPFTSMRNPEKPQLLAFWQAANTENDESLIFVNHHAKKMGMLTLMKPHIWMNNNWPGDIKMNSEKDWDLFFEYYYRWIRHFAILSEMYMIPILSMGNELSKATLGHEEKWIELASNIRSFYSGKITYGANWGNEFENLSFWNHFDYIGISQYYPISKKDDPTDRELIEGAKNVINKIEKIHERFNKPLIFTEVGYRNSKAPWKSFYEKEGRRKKNPDSQVRAYKALLEAIKGKEWLAGIYFWKWPSYLNYPFETREEIYTPVFNPAEEIVKEEFKKIE